MGYQRTFQTPPKFMLAGLKPRTDTPGAGLQRLSRFARLASAQENGAVLCQSGFYQENRIIRVIVLVLQWGEQPTFGPLRERPSGEIL